MLRAVFEKKMLLYCLK